MRAEDADAFEAAAELLEELLVREALLSTTLPDGMYYEITYNGDKGEAYVDAYKKWQNLVVVV